MAADTAVALKTEGWSPPRQGPPARLMMVAAAAADQGAHQQYAGFVRVLKRYGTVPVHLAPLYFELLVALVGGRLEGRDAMWGVELF